MTPLFITLIPLIIDFDKSRKITELIKKATPQREWLFSILKNPKSRL